MRYVEDSKLGPSRREALLGLAATAGASLVGGPALGSPRTVRLHEAAARAGVLFGTSIAQDAMDDLGLGALYADQARLFTADWAMKLDVMRPAEDVFDTSYADVLLGFADRMAIPMRGTCIAWNDSRTDWLAAMSAAEKRKALDRHVEETAAHFRGRLHSWDVVNEPFWPDHGAPGGYRDGPWLEAFGPDYVERCFKRVEAVDPGCRLVLNEAHAEQWTERGAAIRKGMLALIDRLLDAGVRLDAVGFQGHMFPQWPYDDQGFADYLHEVAARGVDLYVTELDCSDFGMPDDVAVRDAMVAARYEAFLGAVLSVPAVRVVITWQLSDRATHFRAWDEAIRLGRETRPLPFDAALRPKPAFDAMIRAFEAAPPR